MKSSNGSIPRRSNLPTKVLRGAAHAALRLDGRGDGNDEALAVGPHAGDRRRRVQGPEELGVRVSKIGKL